MMASKAEKEEKRADKVPVISAKDPSKSKKGQPKAAAKDSGKSKKEQPKASKGSGKGSKKESVLKRILNYFHNVRLEIKRTTWPTRSEVLNMTLIVIGALIFFGVLIFILDWVMTNLLVLYSLLTPETTTGGTQ
ncbi:MAG: preprotein translocase subunit SecE [Coriobacteriales bacterium]|jgi:preprotein translocase subunit SecE|nr:preprotein translocase subunit SecE [Coriobacteriales bacterium]